MRILLFNILIFLLLDIALGIAYDAYKNNRDPEKRYRQRSRQFHHGLKPGYSGVTEWEIGTPYEIHSDNLGFRSRKGKRTELAKKGPRTLWIGDSFTEGIGVPYDSTFVGRFEAKHPGHEMVNMGVLSYSPLLYRAKLRHYSDKGLDYDNLIVCIDISDIQDEVIYRKELVESDTSLAFLEDGFANKYMSYSITLRTISYLDRHNRERRRRSFDDDRPAWATERRVFDRWGREGLQLAATHMDEIARWNSVSGRRMCIVIYPWPYHIRNRSYVNAHTAFWRGFCSQRGIRLIDLFPAFEKACDSMGEEKMMDSLFIRGDSHWNARGHEFIFRAIDEGLSGSGFF